MHTEIKKHLILTFTQAVSRLQTVQKYGICVCLCVCVHDRVRSCRTQNNRSHLSVDLLLFKTKEGSRIHSPEIILFKFLVCNSNSSHTKFNYYTEIISEVNNVHVEFLLSCLCEFALFFLLPSTALFCVHWTEYKMNNRKFFFERYLINNYLSNFST